ncbi:MAG TPA: hypothetical protein VFJ82_07965 [Longimicrobium sp.]|nr:hypothetical protein [Longimicrobium sp.]
MSPSADPSATTVDSLIGDVNDRYGTRFPRLADLAPGTSLPALWTSAATERPPIPPEVLHAAVDAPWTDGVTGFTLRLTLVISKDETR